MEFLIGRKTICSSLREEAGSVVWADGCRWRWTRPVAWVCWEVRAGGDITGRKPWAFGLPLANFHSAACLCVLGHLERDPHGLLVSVLTGGWQPWLWDSHEALEPQQMSLFVDVDVCVYVGGRVQMPEIRGWWCLQEAKEHKDPIRENAVLENHLGVRLCCAFCCKISFALTHGSSRGPEFIKRRNKPPRCLQTFLVTQSFWVETCSDVASIESGFGGSCKG